MKFSKKFALGTIHENGSGVFEIVDRYEEDGIVYLKCKYVESGEVITNKEVNVNASIWKFQNVRGLVGNSTKRYNGDLVEEVKELREKLDQAMDIIKMQQSQITSILKLISEK